MNVAQILAQSGARNPGKIAIDFEGIPYTYAQIDERVKRCAGFLKQIGVKKGIVLQSKFPSPWSSSMFI